MFNQGLKNTYAEYFSEACFKPRTDYDYVNKSDICSKILRYYNDLVTPGISFCIASESKDTYISEWYKSRVEAKINQNLDLDFIVCIEDKTGDFFMLEKLYFWY